MSDLLLRLIEDAPYLVIMLVLVVTFLRFIESAAKRNEDTMKAIGHECHAHGNEREQALAEVVRGNRDYIDQMRIEQRAERDRLVNALEQNTRMLGALESVLRGQAPTAP